MVATAGTGVLPLPWHHHATKHAASQWFVSHGARQTWRLTDPFYMRQETSLFWGILGHSAYFERRASRCLSASVDVPFHSAVNKLHSNRRDHPPPWKCEADSVPILYHDGLPLNKNAGANYHPRMARMSRVRITIRAQETNREKGRHNYVTTS